VALAFLFDRLEKGIIDRIIIFCNPVAAKDAAKLGFYPGDRVQKLIDSQVGGILSSKLGSTDQVMRYIEQEKIVLMPAADARGYETPPNSGVYIMEAQNLDITLMKMLI
jgi:phosphate starvation-inducible protein PhoH